ncbi:MAG TPA: class I SAM-dependent methyltransferase [Planctomycetota bacterium]|nr:class I SAM-dependent methyltransferase [Planctomycetota bacterium]
MLSHTLQPGEILAAYDRVSQLYPRIPSMSAWRSFEFAGYRRFQLIEPVLDIGCGDGQFFRLLWPDVKIVEGVDFNPATAEAARHSGVYRSVHAAPADKMPIHESAYASAFANCSLEHMDNLHGVLNAIARNLRPGAPFVLSVVTDKFIEWQMLPLLIEKSGAPDLARRLAQDHIDYHNLVNALPAEVWAQKIQAAGFEIEEHIPIVPELSSRLILFFDQLWHVSQPGGELGSQIHAQLERFPNFRAAYRRILRGVIEMETGTSGYSGAIFKAVRK